MTAVTIDIAGGQVGGAARYSAEVLTYLQRSARDDVKVIGLRRRLTPAWLAVREAAAVRRSRRVALNNVGFFTPGGERWTLVANPLHFLTSAEMAAQVPAIRTAMSRQIPVVYRAARQSDVLVAPCTAMAERIKATLPDVADRVIARLHPISASTVTRRPDRSRILCPILFAPYKKMPDRLAEWVAAVDESLDESVRMIVTAGPDEVPPSLAASPRIELAGRLDLDTLNNLWASSQAIYFPSGLESFGYPLGEARANGQPVIAQDTPQNREIGGPALCGYTAGDPDSLRRATETALSLTLEPDPGPFDPNAYFDWLLGGTRVTRLGLRPWCDGDGPRPGSVPVTVAVLTLNEEVNIARCLASVGWADQVIVIDSGSTDGTVKVADSLGATVIEQPWLGFSGQREFALRLPAARHDWIYFVDADEWVSPQLAAEIADRMRAPEGAAYAQRFRLVFQGNWIRHCGWYGGSWLVRLVDRRRTRFDGSLVGERARADGPLTRLANDIVDEDLKGLASWLHKHVRYAELEQRRRGAPLSAWDRICRFRLKDQADTRPWSRVLLKDLVYPLIPAKPLALFLYMYVLRLGVLDGPAGLRFCFFHAWYQVAVGGLQAEARRLSALSLAEEANDAHRAA